MSKPKHRMRGKGRRIGYGLWTTDLVMRKRSLNYEQALTKELARLGGSKVSLKHWKKLCRYLGRVQ